MKWIHYFKRQDNRENFGHQKGPIVELYHMGTWNLNHHTARLPAKLLSPGFEV
jgi:hypothetical protein